MKKGANKKLDKQLKAWVYLLTANELNSWVTFSSKSVLLSNATAMLNAFYGLDYLTDYLQ
ncbi:hypothetical protein BIW11_05104 [Tropilaelaps mercedesae]|uniref:Uncharacterized protein n=1 Tax=Tropilaelaps mercedesae TaxID=418985 RepID=A0A1V9Y3Z7_9ACAR|nr:hypothetical protein BIW11_05104 [Tropilaelaps mercedesae]